MCAAYRFVAAVAAFMVIAPIVSAQEHCPSPHADYRRPTPVWEGFGYQVNACPGDKIEVAAELVVAQTGTQGIIKIPQTLPWHVDLAGLRPDQMSYLREHCEADLPCAAHFKISVLRIERDPLPLKPGEWREGDQACSGNSYMPPRSGFTSCRPMQGPARVIATLDGWRP